MYQQDGTLYTMALDKVSAPVRVADSVASFYDWIDGESVVFTRGYEFWISSNQAPELWTKRIGEARARKLVSPDSARGILGISFPSVLPGAQRALVTIWTGDLANVRRELAIVSLADGSLTSLGIAGSNGRYARGHLIFVQEDGALYSAPFSVSEGKVTGTVVQIVPQVVTRLTGWADFDVADNGTLTYVGGSEARRRLMLVDRHGASTPVGSEIRRFFFPRVSPDGRRIAVEVGLPQGFDIWTYDRDSRTFGAMTTDHRSLRPGGWTRDGGSLAYIHSDADTRKWNAVIQSVNGDAPRRTLGGSSLNIRDVTVGGQQIVYRQLNTAIGTVPLADPSKARILMPESEGTGSIRLSPDGRYLAYEGSASGNVEIYARSINDGDARLQVSSGGGSEPVWSPTGDEIFYRGESHLMAARVALNPLRVLRRDTLFRDTFIRAAAMTNYDVMPGGQQFIMVQSENPDVYPTVLVNRIRPR
jgi:serine/threonine-protein kinase